MENLIDIDPVGDVEPIFVESDKDVTRSIIKVMGVGGGGGNAVKHMYDEGIVGVDFMLCNTDAQALERLPIPFKIQLGEDGLGAGAVPMKARDAAIDSEERIKDALRGAKMLFITAGMGGGTGTGASPIVASIAREMGILTVGIVTFPFDFEGRSKLEAAKNGLDELRQNVDALIVIKNEALKELYPDMTFSNAFAKSDDVLLIAARSIAELITIPGIINVDFEDVKTIMQDSGTAIIGSGVADGETRAKDATERAISSPLLENNSIYGAEKVLLFITYKSGQDITMDEFGEITRTLEQQTCNMKDKLIWGYGVDDSLNDREVRVTVIATGFHDKAPDKSRTVNFNEESASIGLKEEEKAENTNVQKVNLGEKAPSVNRTYSQYPERESVNEHPYTKRIDNASLRNMSDEETEEYLNTPAYNRRAQRPTSDSYECSSYRAGISGVSRDASAYLQSKESID